MTATLIIMLAIPCLAPIALITGLIAMNSIKNAATDIAKAKAS